MKTPCIALLLALSASCAAVPNPDRRAWSEEAPPLPELLEAAAPLEATPVQPSRPARPPQEVNEMEIKRPRPQASRIWVLLGGRKLDDDYSPVEDQGVLGLEYSYEGSNSIVGFEVGLMGSYDEDTLAGNVGVGELYGGVRKTFRRDARFQPYVGGGISLATVRFDPLIGGDEQDSTVGGYGHGGFAIMLGRSFHLGLDLRALFGTDVTLAGTDTNVNYTQAALVLGWLL